jgi:hypothetical protein
MRAEIEELLGLFRNFLGGFPGEPVAGFRRLVTTAGGRRDLEPKSLSCLRHLDRAAEIASGPARPLANWLAGNRRHLRWGQTYTEADFGRGFIDNYGWVELIGTRGHFASDELAAGFLILGPGILYPDHHHRAEEGAFSQRDACEVIHHPPNINHAMRTGAEPLLALYLWRGGPLAQKSVIAG